MLYIVFLRLLFFLFKFQPEDSEAQGDILAFYGEDDNPVVTSEHNDDFDTEHFETKIGDVSSMGMLHEGSEGIGEPSTSTSLDSWVSMLRVPLTKKHFTRN